MLLLTSCTTAPLMRDSGFQMIPVGGSIAEVEVIYGEPFEVRSIQDGMEEYVYIHRIECGGTVEMTEYVLTVYQGRIVGKNKRLMGSTASIGITQ